MAISRVLRHAGRLVFPAVFLVAASIPASAQSVSVGSVYAGDYNGTGKYPMRISASGACNFTLVRYGGSAVWSGTLTGGDSIVVLDGPSAGGSPWTLVKKINGVQKGGTHVLSPATPYKLKILHILLEKAPVYAPVGKHVEDSTWTLFTGDSAKMKVIPDPAWAVARACSSLYEWRENTNLIALGITYNPAYADTGKRTVNVRCHIDTGKTTTINVIKNAKIPLGLSRSINKYVIGKIYVPDSYGGNLKVLGTSSELFYTDGSSLDTVTTVKIFESKLESKKVATGNPCTYAVPEGKHGWYYVKVTVEASTTVSDSFVQDGQASTTPWNGWYWPSKSTVNPNLYSNAGLYTPLKKYDQVYSTAVRVEEDTNYGGGDGWWGHCWGWSLVAIGVAQPAAVTKNGVSFNQDEMEGLYSELGDGAQGGWTWRVGRPNARIPAGPPTAALGEPVDSWAGRVHKGFREYIRKQKKAMNANLRASSVGDAAQVWNHDVYKYVSSMQETSAGNEKIIQINTDITSNMDTPAMPADGTVRNDTYVYVVEYDNSGNIVVGSGNQNWISASAYAPSCLGTVEALMLNRGRHCAITQANVSGLSNP